MVSSNNVNQRRKSTSARLQPRRGYYSLSMKYKLLFFIIFFQWACNTDSSIKIDSSMRRRIDTTTSRQINLLSAQMDAYCRDSSAALIQRAADSMLAVRQKEVLNK
jgi:hypothetical protein